MYQPDVSPLFFDLKGPQGGVQRGRAALEPSPSHLFSTLSQSVSINPNETVQYL